MTSVSTKREFYIYIYTLEITYYGNSMEIFSHSISILWKCKFPHYIHTLSIVWKYTISMEIQNPYYFQQRSILFHA